ncbi:MAG: DUF1707 domain-containing protein [Saccharopolyspora sp.]|uniref:DUF1707 SHOCT-like domain-containing protein n=1 Tax=Saccharopolyspora sp. TaxID=33915 RepID=UPI0025EAAA1C|nr:DUF1707 domain-containing protein [Saccharopolyspora sp.]MBQ6640254.1 DUF1707 domain-containing protein [Saccharopolyspora sp.]
MGSGRNLRVGDAERETAIKALGEHLTAGRLDVGEYDQRCADAAAARFQSDLRALFAHLPNMVSPPHAQAPEPPRRRPVGRIPLGIVLLLVCVVGVLKPILLLPLAAAAAALVLLMRR